MVDVDVRVLSHFKEELAQAADKQPQVINTIMLFKNSNKELKKKAVLNLEHVVTYVAQRRSYQ